MHNLSKIVLAACLFLTAASVFAHDEPEEDDAVDPWDGTGEAGLVKTTGNTDNNSVECQAEFHQNGGEMASSFHRYGTDDFRRWNQGK